MNESQQLRESMWDFVYGLLSEEESQALIERIKSEPQAARLYSEVRLQADLIGEASRVEDSSVVLNTAVSATASDAQHVTPKAAAGSLPGAARGKAESHRRGAWLAGIGATALAALLAVGLFWPRLTPQSLAGNFIAADVTGPRSMQAGLTSKIAVRTYLVSTDGAPADGTKAALDIRLLDRAGQERFRKELQTDAAGLATVEIPGEVLEPGVRLEVATSPPAHRDFGAMLADQEADQERLVESKRQTVLAAELTVEPEPQLAYVLQSEPTPASGKAVPYAVWNFSAFSAKPGPAEETPAVTEATNGALRAESSAGVSIQEGLARGALQLQAGGKAENLTLGTDKSELEKLRTGQDAARVVSAGESVAVSIPPELAGKPVSVAAVNRGVRIATASAGENKSQDVDGSRKKAGGDAPIGLALPPEADGLIELEYFDRSISKTEPAAREFVYRQPTRKLQIELPADQNRFAPGQEVELALRVTDERGQPAANARLGVRVWNERLVKQSAEQPVLLADAYHGATANDARGANPALLQRAQGNESAEERQNRFARRQSELPRAAGTPSDALAESAASTRRGEQTELVLDDALASAEPIELASSRQTVVAALRGAAANAETDRRRAMEWIGRALVIGGIGLLVMLGALAVLRMAASARAMTPALVAALASLCIGVMWIDWTPRQRMGQIAMAPAASATSAPTEDSLRPLGELDAGGYREAAPSGGAGAASAPASAPVPMSGDANIPLRSAFGGGAGGGRGTVAESNLKDAQPAEPSPARELAIADKRAVGQQDASAPQPSAAVLGRGPASSRPAVAAQNEEQAATVRARAAPGMAGGLSAPASAGRSAPVPAGPAAKSDLGVRLADEAASKELRDDRADAKSIAVAPPSLYFNPELMTDAGGRATIRFVMPAVESEYRLLIDALGSGRIGSRQEVLVIGGPATAK